MILHLSRPTHSTPRPLRLATALAAAGAALALAGCGAQGTKAQGTPAPHAVEAASSATKMPVPGPERATASARLMTADGQPAGTAVLTETPSGVEIAAQVQGLSAGLHGFHIHANGQCAPGPDAATGKTIPFGAAGGHFDPGMSHQHGQPGAPIDKAHAGELPNITVGADGRGTLRYLNSNITLTPGRASIMGRALVVHEKEDDYKSNPAGNSGGRVLCGVIEPAQPSSVVGQAPAPRN
ncbi:superoxide dismutase family protein [Paracidovorax avenae]|uniref:superoxide dismutase family protein n=1 Tax=Paracidovorax avenae TaxID=80867 RepID=UPI000D20EA3C|nr:superoxide dismutase family protein [Paracidovorax avenae]AVT02974.1 superoxide dismutase family protein [Paracidovorax avenae]AVT09785.1 superoxide dismutase family protein [Paracidovorax avenae]